MHGGRRRDTLFAQSSAAATAAAAAAYGMMTMTADIRCPTTDSLTSNLLITFFKRSRIDPSKPRSFSIRQIHSCFTMTFYRPF